MLAIELRFLAGRYHATPWGHNVNEGLVEWPPSPYRLARALVDACKRRRPDWDEARLNAIIKVLEIPLGFKLPPATASHLRAYMSSNTTVATDKQKILDAFVAIDRNAPLIVGFDAAPTVQVRSDLGELLEELNYFGRSESWITARVLDVQPPEFDCVPATDAPRRKGVELVRVASLRPEAEYATLPCRPRKRGGKSKASLDQLPWIDAIMMSSADLLAEGWSEPPSQKNLDFLRPRSALQPEVRGRKRGLQSQFRAVRYSLDSTVLPRVDDTVPFAERVRTHLMGIHKRIMGGDPARVSPLFSGKRPDGGPAIDHEHAFILPRDEDGNGRIDHLVVYVARPFDSSELEALDSLRSLWQPGGRPDVNLVLVSLADVPQEPSGRYWVSSTPFVTGRHHRRGRGSYEQWLADELRRECHNHNMAQPETIQWVGSTQTHGHAVAWRQFVRSRRGQRPLRGHGCVLTFAEPVQGPIVLGALCHFGLGQFVLKAVEGE